MKIKKVVTVCFSPTGSTKKVLSLLTEGMPVPVEQMDITCHGERDRADCFGADVLVIFGIPVYGGRVPAPAIQTMKQMQGDGTPAVLVATYGNRDYDDALLELKNTVEETGFVSLAAAAFVTEHSIMHSVAHGRPDAEDRKKIKEFSRLMWKKAEEVEECSRLAPLEVGGKFPYREYGGVPLKPQASKACTACGICAEQCPVRAIPADSPEQTNTDICISCMHCIQACPVQARKLNKLMLPVAEKGFAKKCSERKEAQFFI